MNSRIINAIISDMNLTVKQGFFSVYAVVSIIYIVVLNQLNIELASKVLPILVFTDPSVLGLFFIGGIILLEKQEGIINLLSVTPLSTTEYLIGKIFSLSFISIIASIVICLFTVNEGISWFLLIVGVLGVSVFFILFGIVIVSVSKSVNDFFVKMIPGMIIFAVASILLFIYREISIISYFPGITGFKIIIDSLEGQISSSQIIPIFYMVFVDILMFYIGKSVYEKRIVYRAT